MDTMTATKIVGGVAGSLLIFLLVKWGAQAIYSPEGDHEIEAAYVIEVEETAAEMASTEGEVGEAEAAAAPTFDEVYAVADVASGAKIFKKCKACHKLEDGANATGPFLFGVVGRGIATVADFKYSGGLSGIGGDWTPTQLNAFLTRPKDFAPGTKMSFAGLKNESDRANIIAYLATIGG